MNKTIYLPIENKYDFEKTVEKFNKKLVRNSVDSITFKYIENKYLVDVDRTVIETEIEFPNVVNLKDEEEYHFVGTIAKVDGNLTYNAINCDSELFRNAEIKCECCGKKINRSKSIVMSLIEKPTKVEELKFFGSSCAKEYFTVDFEQIFNFFQCFIKTIEDDCGACGDYDDFGHRGGFDDTVNLDELIDAVRDCTHDFTEYKSMNNYGSDCTRFDVENWLKNGK